MTGLAPKAASKRWADAKLKPPDRPRFCYARARAYWSLNCTVGATLNEHAADTATPRGRLQPELWPKKCEIHWSAQKWHLARGPNGCEP
jgi:hypothetical protein